MEVKRSARDLSPDVNDNVNRSNVDAGEARMCRCRNVNTKKETLRCALVTEASVKSFKEKFSELCGVEQKAFVLMYCTSSAVKRRRGKEAGPRRSLAAVYKNQVLPKVPDQEAYYSRQLYEYHL
ncbi:hypothetical protein HPB50_008502 [Hyalomma asiaticum]|uniref:Uncharacterized protein n=1 Tax=Hyalomma asiaticum TaxID=266040 RepID=A0ACB7TEE8_HYAAI|nr:hypothetical protein HPB50_008502 [Hyalomma asiaticum]